MNYKLHLLTNYDNLCKIKKILETKDTNYFTTTKINEKNLDENTISIVMTACNRPIQTYFTIDIIAKSSYKNVQIILVDDSTDDPVMLERLSQFGVHIELITIKNKFWVNPCVNYNIGFQHIRGGKVIIQNAEVCHMGDVLKYVEENVIDDGYYAFNVYALQNESSNNMLYDIGDMSSDNYEKITSLPHDIIYNGWYQHLIYRNAYYHFLVALTTKTFNKIGGFDIDYAMAVGWDDNELVFKLQENNVNLLNVTHNVMGIHQWHKTTAAGRYDQILNYHLYNCKCKYYDLNGSFLNLTCYDKEHISEIVNKWF